MRSRGIAPGTTGILNAEIAIATAIAIAEATSGIMAARSRSSEVTQQVWTEVGTTAATTGPSIRITRIIIAMATADIVRSMAVRRPIGRPIAPHSGAVMRPVIANTHAAAADFEINH
jgi:hypothetical protein